MGLFLVESRWTYFRNDRRLFAPILFEGGTVDYASAGPSQEMRPMFALLRLPTGSVLLLNDIGRLPPPYTHGQALIRLRLDNGMLVEAIWDDYRHTFCITGYEAQDDVKLRAVSERLTPNREWVSGAVNSMAWELAFNKAETCGAEPDTVT